MAAPQVPLEVKLEPNPELSDGSKAPEHHIIPVPVPSTGWASYLQSWYPAGAQGASGFRNPWPSWHKATTAEVLNSLQWGEESLDPCVALAASHLSETQAPLEPPRPDLRPNFTDIADWPYSDGAKAARLLQIETPNFSFPDAPSSRPCAAKVTWLGHSGVLLQLPPLTDRPSDRPLRCLFDPIFSMRCSPSQAVGPIRSYPPPCDVRALPLIDAVFISHNHYDHLDYDTIMAVWERSRSSVRFFVPLGNGKWFVDCGIPADRVTELDWWDSAVLTPPGSNSGPGSRALKIWCTPAQHGSGRTGTEVDGALWSSWFLEHPGRGEGKTTPYRIFFAGDTGYQFHDSPSWPPPPPLSALNGEGETTSPPPPHVDDKFPACPAFAEIRNRLGSPQLLLLPVSVGATFAYLRSLVYLPDWISPFPRHTAGLTAATHMPSWDAVRVLKVMTDDTKDEEPAVAVAVHWGTFVPESEEVLRTLGQLEWACQSHGVKFARSLPPAASVSETAGNSDGGGGSRKPWFLALNHGQSICT